MNFAVITIFPEIFNAVTQFGISSRAFNEKKISLITINPRKFTTDRYQTVDDRPFGGGPGMVMMYEPLKKSICEAKKKLNKKAKVVYLSPQGKLLAQDDIKRFSSSDGDLVLVCGRYEGIDERLIQHYVDEEISIGDYVLSGGEIPAMVLIDSIVRLLPGVLKMKRSIIEDSFYDGLLDHPHYTRPASHFEGGDVPEILLSGNHEKIQKWRHNEKLKRTFLRREKLIKCLCLSDKDKEYLKKIMQLKEKNSVENAQLGEKNEE